MSTQDHHCPQVSADLYVPVGLAALLFSGLYLLSDVVELVQGGFSTSQLVLTYIAEAAIPLFVLGLYAAQRPHIGVVGLAAAVGYAYTFVFFTGTVLFALVNQTSSWQSLTDELGGWVTLHGVLMVVTGLAFGYAVTRAGVLPAWTGALLMLGVVLIAVSSGMPAGVQTLAAGARDLAFAAMGVSLLGAWRRDSVARRDSLVGRGSGGEVPYRGELVATTKHGKQETRQR